MNLLDECCPAAELTMVDFAGSRGFFCPDVAGDAGLLGRWATLGGAAVAEAAEADYHFSDDANNETARR